MDIAHDTIKLYADEWVWGKTATKLSVESSLEKGLGLFCGHTAFCQPHKWAKSLKPQSLNLFTVFYSMQMLQIEWFVPQVHKIDHKKTKHNATHTNGYLILFRTLQNKISYRPDVHFYTPIKHSRLFKNKGSKKEPFLVSQRNY